jgi:hypothetical protein
VSPTFCATSEGILSRESSRSRGHSPTAVTTEARGDPDYFANVPKGQLDKALIDPAMLNNYRGFRKFIRERRTVMVGKLSEQIGLTDAEFHRS